MVYHGEKGKMSGARDSWWHCIHSQEADECWWSAGFFLFYSVWTSIHGMVRPIFKYSSLYLAQYRDSLTAWPISLFLSDPRCCQADSVNNHPYCPQVPPEKSFSLWPNPDTRQACWVIGASEFSSSCVTAGVCFSALLSTSGINKPCRSRCMSASTEARANSVKVLASRISKKGSFWGSVETMADKITPTGRQTKPCLFSLAELRM